MAFESDATALAPKVTTAMPALVHVCVLVVPTTTKAGKGPLPLGRVIEAENVPDFPPDSTRMERLLPERVAVTFSFAGSGNSP